MGTFKSGLNEAALSWRQPSHVPTIDGFEENLKKNVYPSPVNSSFYILKWGLRVRGHVTVRMVISLSSNVL